MQRHWSRAWPLWQHPGSHRHLARADRVRGSSGKTPGTAKDGGSLDLPCNLLLLHIVLLTSVCSPGVGRQRAGSRSVSRLVPGVEQMFWDLSGLVCTWLWQGFGCLALGFRPPFLGCD